MNKQEAPQPDVSKGIVGIVFRLTTIRFIHGDLEDSQSFINKVNILK